MKDEEVEPSIVNHFIADAHVCHGGIAGSQGKCLEAFILLNLIKNGGITRNAVDVRAKLYYKFVHLLVLKLFLQQSYNLNLFLIFIHFQELNFR